MREERMADNIFFGNPFPFWCLIRFPFASHASLIFKFFLLLFLLLRKILIQ